MRILLFAERITGRPWSPTAAVVPIARALGARDEVTLAADLAPGLDPSACRPARAIVRRPAHTADDRDPRGFRRWTRRLVRELPHDFALALSPLACADARLDLSPCGERESRIALARAGPIGAGFEILDRAWLPAAVLLGRGAAPAIEVPAPSLLEPGEAAADFREALRVDAGRPIYLATCTHAEEPTFAAMLAGFARSAGEAVLLIAGRWAWTARESARECGDGVRVVGATSRLPDLLRASSLALATSAVGSGRFAVDALRLGKPVLVPAGTAAEKALRRAGDPPPGAVVAEPSADAWARAIARAASIAPASGARAEEFSFACFIDRLRAAIRQRASSAGAW